MKKFSKYLVVLVSLAIVFSFCVSVSAAHYTAINMPIGQPTISDDFAYVEVVQQLPNGNYEGFVYLISRQELSVYDCSFGFYTSSTTGQQTILFHNTTDYMMNIYCVGQDGQIWNTGWVIDGDIKDAFSGNVVSIRTYGNIRNQHPEYDDDLPFVFVYGSDNVSNQLLNEIRILLENSSGSAGSIVGSIQSSTGEIIKQQQENTDKIINGGKDYNNVDGSTINNYVDSDAQLNASIDDSKSNSISFFNNFGNVLINTPVQRGLLFVSATMKEFFAIDWLSNILTFGLALGAFAFILGATVMVVRAGASKERQQKRDEYYKSRRKK